MKREAYYWEKVDRTHWEVMRTKGGKTVYRTDDCELAEAVCTELNYAFEEGYERGKQPDVPYQKLG